MKWLEIDIEETRKWERFYRASFFNSLAGFKSANLIGTINQAGQSNLAIFFSVIHVGANPPLLGLLFRPHTVRRDSLENIRAIKLFTVNSVQKEWTEAAHGTAANYEAGVSEFKANGLTEEFLGGAKVPFVKESKIKSLCRLEEEHPVAANGTIFMVAAIEKVYLQEGLIADDGLIQHDQAGTVAINALDTYYTANLFGQYDYARPGERVKPKN